MVIVSRWPWPLVVSLFSGRGHFALLCLKVDSMITHSGHGSSPGRRLTVGMYPLGPMWSDSMLDRRCRCPWSDPSDHSMPVVVHALGWARDGLSVPKFDVGLLIRYFSVRVRALAGTG